MTQHVVAIIGTDPAVLRALTRFWEKVNIAGTDECWVWTGSTNYGYGQFAFRERQRSPAKAHRFSYEVAYGRPPDHLHVCHSCDNPSCVNPSHLFLGTDYDNVHDAKRKGRLRTGSDHQNYGKTAAEIFAGKHKTDGARKLTDSQVREMKHMRAGGSAYKDIASAFGVSVSCAWVNCTDRNRRSSG
jgi:hypothetical protein